MHPRYFIGITLPEKLSKQISEFQNSLLMPGKIMDPLVPHITLLDPNVLMSVSPLYIIPKAAAAAAKLMPLTIHLNTLDIFHNQVLHITVESSGLIELQANLAQLLPEKVRAGYYLGRNYTPHITLAQAKPKQKLSSEIISNYVIQVKTMLPYTFEANHLTQFSWQSPRTYRVNKV